jgi:UDP-apiose/xylose synthase
MRQIYKEKFGRPEGLLPDIVNVSADEFYGQGYEDSDRRIPDITKAKTLLGWEPRYPMAELLERTMQYYIVDD